MDKEEKQSFRSILPFYRFGILGTGLPYGNYYRNMFNTPTTLDRWRKDAFFPYRNLFPARFPHPPSTGPRWNPVGFPFGNLLAYTGAVDFTAKSPEPIITGVQTPIDTDLLCSVIESDNSLTASDISDLSLSYSKEIDDPPEKSVEQVKSDGESCKDPDEEPTESDEESDESHESLEPDKANESPETIEVKSDKDDTSILLSNVIIDPNYLESRDLTASEAFSSEEHRPSIDNDWIIIEDKV
jgi:hypothetical protein